MTLLKNALVGLTISGLLAASTAHASDTRAAAALPAAGVSAVTPHLAKMKRHDAQVSAYSSSGDSAGLAVVGALGAGAFIAGLCFATNVCGHNDSNGG